MKRVILFLMLVVCILSAQAGEQRTMIPRYNRITKQTTSYPLYNVHDVQYCSPDSLLKADSLQLTNDGTTKSDWTLQASHFTLPVDKDTVVVIATVVAPAHILTFTAGIGWTLLIHDTSSSNFFGGALVRVGNNASGVLDTIDAIADGIENVEQGNMIMITCMIEEFPTPNLINSTTQLRPVPGYPFQIIGTGTIPPPTKLNVSDFYTAAYPGGKIQFSHGEPYEGSLVEFTNLRVVSTLNSGRGTWTMQDNSGNSISDYDASYYFTRGNAGGGGDPSFVPLVTGQIVDTIRGTILTVSGGENPRGYRICPIYSGDIVLGTSLPFISTHRRYPSVVRSTDSAEVTVIAKKNAGGYGFYRAVLMKSINNSPWQADTMDNLAGDTLWYTYIVDVDGNPYPNGTTVKYFLKAIDSVGTQSILANPSTAFGTDTSKGFFFYTVHDGEFTIHDLRYTPYLDGLSAYDGGVATVRGVVTADTSNIQLTQTTITSGSFTDIYGTSAWYIQQGTTPWSGLWIVSKDSTTQGALAALRLGDSVVVTGTVQEYTNAFTQVFDHVRIQDSLLTVVAHNRPLPQPIDLKASRFIAGVGFADTSALPYDAMLVRFVRGQIADTYPTFADPSEYSFDDGTGAIIVRSDGINTYSNTPGDTSVGRTHIFHIGDQVDTLIGILYGSYSRWKVVPRRDNDFVAGNPYTFASGWNMVSIPRTQLPYATGYDASLLYPGISSKVFAYNGASYVIKTTLANDIGYWVKYATQTTVKELGAARTNDTIPLLQGWNLVGALGSNLLSKNVTGITPVNNILSKFFGYSGGYSIADTLKPAHGYWVKASLAGSMVLTTSGGAFALQAPQLATSEFNTITISDKKGNKQVLYFAEDPQSKMRMSDFEMPPSAPEVSGFDARFVSGRILESYKPDTKEGTTYAMVVTSENAPITIEWNIARQGNQHFILSDEANGKLLKPTEMKGRGTATLRQSGMIGLDLRISSTKQIPRVFALSANYPNPFNPSTKFNVDMPKQSHLEITVYDILGQRVSTLVDEVRDAGSYTVTWDGRLSEGAPAASGIYFVRMKADQFTAVQKMVLMK